MGGSPYNLGMSELRASIAVATGSRAEFGLLRPVMRAVAARAELELIVIAAGSHLVPPAVTLRDIKGEFFIADLVPMQVAGRDGRADDAEAVGRGVAKFARTFERLSPACVVVLGDRIEAFAAASAASIGGTPLAHVHGGDRAEGVADEAMRHAISKLAHVHFPATAASAERLIRMGEDPASVHVVGSPAIDDLAEMPEIDDAAWRELGEPQVLFLMHPIGRTMDEEQAAAAQVLAACGAASPSGKVLALMPNFDAGRTGIVRAIEQAKVACRSHLPRETFVGVLKRLAARGGVLVGNSSAGLIEAAALRLPVVNVGERQAGRERCANVVEAAESRESVAAAMERARTLPRQNLTHVFGDGTTGRRVAEMLVKLFVGQTAEGRRRMVRKRCVY
jgi:UDP-hydrolysing UDP-N-acetyl-D-glucosamine 2-epimerase